ncbi:MAG: MlaD family protein [bacterium]|nr:MlaD family protein [bacterium]
MKLSFFKKEGSSRLQREAYQNWRIGLFVLVGIVILAITTLKVTDRQFSSGTYKVWLVLNSATGLDRKTPVEIAGVQVGYIDGLELFRNRQAKVKLRIDDGVVLTKDTRAQVRTKGFLGDTYIDLQPGDEASGTLEPGAQIESVNPFVDLSELTTQISDISKDVKVVTGAMRQTFAEGGNWDTMMYNFAQLSERLNRSAGKIDRGEGTVGKLIHDDETAQGFEDTVQGLSQTIGSVNRFQAEFGYHLEYLTQSKDFKSYIGLALKPRPDKYFLLELAVDPNPSPTQKITTSSITAGGATSTVVTDQSIVEKNKLLVSAQLAKSFHDLVLRGGLIESRGGVGMDYAYGPYGISFSAFDFRSDGNERPHLKALGQLNLTKNLYLLSGADDFISDQQDLDWFFGAGFRVVDEDIKALFGAASLR